MHKTWNDAIIPDDTIKVSGDRTLYSGSETYIAIDAVNMFVGGKVESTLTYLTTKQAREIALFMWEAANRLEGKTGAIDDQIASANE